MSKPKCKFLVISFTTDWRFSPSRSQELVDALIDNHKPVSYLDIDAEQGHDSFLFPIPLYVKTLRAFLGGEQQLQSTPQELH
jgi:homoserine O-acetyltransferase